MGDFVNDKGKRLLRIVRRSSGSVVGGAGHSMVLLLSAQETAVGQVAESTNGRGTGGATKLIWMCLDHAGHVPARALVEQWL